MKYIIYLILLSINLYSTQLILNRYEEPDQSVDIYHLIDKQMISCTTEYGKGFENIIRCQLAQPLKIDKKEWHDTYFDIFFHGNEVVFKAKRFAQIIPIDERLIDKNVVTKNRSYRHWVIVGARKQPDILVNNGKKKFNFPVKFAKQPPPYIGALDLNGEPVKNKKGAIYLAKIAKMYRAKKYDAVLKLVKQYTSMHHDSFAKEIELYRIRTERGMAQQNREKYEDVLTDALQWIENNPSNKHIPEAYLYVVESYLAKGRLKQAEKFLHMLTGGFTDNKYTQRAEIAYANTIYRQKKRRKEALKIYKKVLYATKDLETASQAAMRIADSYLDFSEPAKAEKIFRKVLKSNPEFVREHYKVAYKLAKRFADAEHYDVALEIAEVLANIHEKDFLDDLLKSMGFWEEGRGNREKAIAIYNKYLKKYKNGKNKAFVLRHLDALMLLQNDANITKKLQFIDLVLTKYEDPDIQKRALEEKAKLLLSEKRYSDVLYMSKKLRKYKLNKYIAQAAFLEAEKALQEHKCETAMRTIQDYNVTVEEKYDDKLFMCEIETGMFKDAMQTGKRHIESKDLHEKLKWLYLMTKLYQKLDKNKKVILVGNDVYKLANTLGESKYKDVLYDIAEAYYNLREYDDLMLKTVHEVEKLFPDDIRNIDLFMKVVRYAQKRNDLLLEVNYAKKVMTLQKKFNVKAYSPRIDIVYAHGLQKLGKYEEGLEVVRRLVTGKLTDRQKAEVLYLAGELSAQLHRKKEAIGYFTECGDIVEDSEWQKLCAENLQLLSE